MIALFIAGFLLFNGIGIYCIVKAVLKAAKESKEANEREMETNSRDIST